MDIKLNITLPSGNIGYVENLRSFVVEGDIISDEELYGDSLLCINLYNSDNKVVRHVECNKKNKDIFAYHPDLITYDENIDKGRNKLKEFGFPALVVDDINNPYETLYKGNIKAWYSNNKFKCLIVNCSNIENGAIFNDGMNFVNENNEPYNCLPIGEYSIEVILSYKNEILAKANKKIIILKNDIQLICRFNPENHKERMFKWADENKYSYIKDLLPGYLDSYLGNWQYHKGLLKMYRANDICLFNDTNAVLFDYLIDSNSTSYETELAYLQSKNRINDKYLKVFYYDIGEAEIGLNKPYYQKAIIKQFNNNEFGHFYRVDLIKNINENVYYLDERNIIESYTNYSNIELNIGDIFAICGVIKPIQLNTNDYILNDDNTYTVNDFPKYIEYSIAFDDTVINDIRLFNMERINEYSIGKSVYEFYNCFKVIDDWKGKHITISCNYVYEKGTKCNILDKINIYVK